MSFLKKIVLVLVVWPFISSAQSADSCPTPTNYKQVIACAESKSPDVVRAELIAKEKNALTGVAGQYQNPELSVETFNGTIDSQQRSETDVSLAFPIELGGKRSARNQIASGAKFKADLELLQARAEVRKSVSLKLFRLRQITSEIEMVDESIQAFTKLVKQYEGRPALSPEQEVTLTVFKVAKSEYSFKKMDYDEELLSLASFFKVTTGLSIEELKKVLPPKVVKWPTAKNGNEKLNSSPLVTIYEAEIQIAKGELSKAQGESWPTLSIGPSAKLTKENGRDQQLWGANLSMPVPVLNANGAGRTAAALTVQGAEQRRDLAIKKLESDRMLLANSYRKSIEALEDPAAKQSLESKHKKVEGFFLRGLVPSSLVIEAHRSLVDFEKTRNERELKAIEAYLDIQFIDGDVVEFVL